MAHRESACQHRIYRLLCDEFDLLFARADGRCEICGEPSQRLWIDHDHDHPLDWAAVRGLVCPKCNAHLRRVDSQERPVDAATRRYLDTAWHLQCGYDPTIPLRSVRVPEDVWRAAQERAAERGESVSAVIVRALRRYGRPR